MKRTSLEKALVVMDYLGRRGSARLIDVSRDLDVPRATAFRMLATLERYGYAAYHRDRRTFALGPRIVELARDLDLRSLVELASPALIDLQERTSETVNLAVLRRGRLSYAAIVEGSHPLRMSGKVDEEVPLHATALGKAVLSVLPPDRRRRLLGPEPFPSFTAGTITSWTELDEELARAAMRGFARDDEEVDAGAVCVAAPIVDATDEPVGAISVSAVTARHTVDSMDKVGESVVRWSKRISRALREDRPGSPAVA